MRGISEAELWMHRNNDRLDWDTRRAFDIVMRICPPKELTPWMPIAEAPKDRLIWGWVDGKKRLIKWGKTSHVPLYGFCLADQGAEDFDLCHPTLYQELPADPE